MTARPSGPGEARAYPRISVVTPSFNQGPFLERTIRSVLDERYPDLEYIVIDGGSTDGSVEIIKRYERHLAYWVSEPDTGQSNAINKGLNRATGTILTWLNSDDYYTPGALEIVATAALGHPDAGAYVGAGDIVDASGAVIHHHVPSSVISLESMYQWIRGEFFMQPSCFFRDTAWRAVAPIDESIHIAFDLDLWMRMAKAGQTFVTIDALLSKSLSHPGAKTTAYTNLSIVDVAVVAIRHGGERVVRQHLDDMAIRLSWSEPNLEKILNNPVLRWLEPLISLFVKPAIRRGDTVPPWLRR
jgi:glycosyltransferase involved in cell wall biosynthesis